MSFLKLKRCVIWTGILALIGVIIALYKTNNLRYNAELNKGKNGTCLYCCVESHLSHILLSRGFRYHEYMSV